VGPHGLKEGRQLILGAELVPFVLGRVRGVGIRVPLGVPQAPQAVLLAPGLLDRRLLGLRGRRAGRGVLELGLELLAELVGLGPGSGGGGVLERPVTLGRAPGKPRESKGVVGLAAKFDDLPLVRAELVEK
jgi:hypothetical protein